MTPDEERAVELHDRATRGETLTEWEREQLAAWYTAQDAAEAATLSGDAVEGSPSQVEGDVAATLQRIAELTRQIQQANLEIGKLRRENGALKRRLAKVPNLNATLGD